MYDSAQQAPLWGSPVTYVLCSVVFARAPVLGLCFCVSVYVRLVKYVCMGGVGTAGRRIEGSIVRAHAGRVVVVVVVCMYVCVWLVKYVCMYAWVMLGRLDGTQKDALFERMRGEW